MEGLEMLLTALNGVGYSKLSDLGRETLSGTQKRPGYE